jgi:uncharacterized peroxidase-related enzyme
MSQFDVHSVATAPAASKPLLQAAQRAIGMVPNLFGVLAEAPAVLEAYQTLDQLFNQTSLTAEDRTVVWQSINVEHGCHYCVPAHSAIARQMKVSSEIDDALRGSARLPDARLEALRAFTLKLVRQRGRLGAGEVLAFLDAGFDRRQLLEVVLGVAQKTLSNYVNAIAGTPLDEPFKPFDW